MCNIRLQAPKLSGKCEIKHCLSLWCGWMVGLSVYGHVIFLSYVAPLVHVELCLYLLFCVTFSECFVQSPSKT